MAFMIENTNVRQIRREDLPELLLTRAEAAAYLGLSVKRLANLACLGRGPRYRRFPCGSVRYEWSDLQTWAASARKAA
ncbi:hypothetical protein ACVWWH_003461 [Sinomonas sp. RB5]